MIIDIKRGKNRLKVPEKAFISKFKPIGYTIYNPAAEIDIKADIDKPKRVTKSVAPDDIKPVQEIKQEESILAEMPLSEMTFQQLQERAKEVGMDASGYAGKRALREALAQYLKK